LQKLNTLFIGKVLLTFPELPSTNAYASDLLSKSRPIEGTVISTANQTDGRGQIGSKWISAPQKNLTCSTILFPKFLEAKHQFFLNIATSLAARETIQTFLPDQKCLIKWPNDLFVEGQKIGGILIQNALQGQHLQSSIIGLGINVLQTEFPDDIPNVTSMKQRNPDVSFSIKNVLHTFCENLEKRYLQLKNEKYLNLKDSYLKHFLGLEEDREFEKPDGMSFFGRITGITDDGRLVINSAGETQFFNLKEVVFLNR
jgi:BirA family biotin operon repressor/biotin-[acetyl-CoA-carboxylase] ligase